MFSPRVVVPIKFLGTSGCGVVPQYSLGPVLALLGPSDVHFATLLIQSKTRRRPGAGRTPRVGRRYCGVGVSYLFH